MRFGVFEILFIGLLLAGLVWVVYQIARPPAAPEHESLKHDLRDLRRRLAALDSAEGENSAEDKGDTH
jgi:hypothetical protein